MSFLRCTACDLQIDYIATEDSSSKTQEFILSPEQLATLCRQLHKGKSLQLGDFLSDEECQLPVCVQCHELIRQIQTFETEIQRLTGLIEEFVSCVRLKLDKSLENSKTEGDQDSSVVKAREFFLGIRTRRTRGRRRRTAKSSPRGTKSETVIPHKEARVVLARLSTPPNVNEGSDAQDPLEDPPKYEIKEEFSCPPVEESATEISQPNSPIPSISPARPEPTPRSRRRQGKVQDYSKLSRGEILSDEELIETEDNEKGDDWLPPEETETEELPRKKRKRVKKTPKGSDDCDPADENSEGSPPARRRKTDSRPRKTARRRLDIKEAEPGIFEWKGVKFRWLEGGKIECGSCKKVLKSKLCLIIHIRKIHLREGVGEFPCSVCGKSFERQESLRVHEDIHAEKRHQCNFCGKLFHQQANLSHHLKSHGEELRFVCEFENCGKKFLTARQLRVHGKRHQGVKSFQCEFCSRMFIFKGELTAHLRSHAQQLPFQCHLCDSKFFIKFRLRRHWKNVHKLDPSDVPVEYHQEVTPDHPVNRGLVDPPGDELQPETCDDALISSSSVEIPAASVSESGINSQDGSSSVVLQEVSLPHVSAGVSGGSLEQVTILLKIL